MEIPADQSADFVTSFDSPFAAQPVNGKWIEAVPIHIEVLQQFVIDAHRFGMLPKSLCIGLFRTQ